MVLIHGGGFVVGSGNIGIHGADFLIEHDVIVVSMNYRLNVFGKYYKDHFLGENFPM